METGHQKHEEPEMEMRSQQLKASPVLLLCCSLAQAQPIVVDGRDLNGTEDNFDYILEHGLENNTREYGVNTKNGTEDCKEECVSSSDPEIYIQWDLEDFDFTTQNYILEDGLENSIEEDGAKKHLEHSGAASIATEQLELLLSSNSLEVDEKKLGFLSGLDIDNGMEDCEKQFGTLCNTWLDFVSWSSRYQKQMQMILETEETDDPEDSVQSFCSLPMDEGSCASKNQPPIFSWFHNPTSGNCEPFWFSGCGGNQNNFDTLDDCENAFFSAGSVNIPLSWIR